MGISAGKDFVDLDGNKFHLEAKDRGVAIWTKGEMGRIMMLDADMARDLADELMTHAQLVDGKEP